ncbi:tRNA glutamyl-Q(34) synthetase GluQRS [Vibrio salinus]|uniref:tRNA glutamyl-Q(34) synthetase GluQRS n=1 Tax=Vibrio salinus TaxID=2899784 RepID=UPI001E359666|nr:tRNA glutamyl-Q(34) synthetase GluQRS [Vibrio salinus]MCE0493352.1 tRNA glutamyl-Q(34) synthetase GluQRS [Vibrio salinus]
MHYVGRFAPSPSGPLHFGSLIAALGSYFQAKSCHGIWLVRIEDIDPPREIPGAASLILKTLEAYGLHWDKSVVYQSQRTEAYQTQIDHWLKEGTAYYCECTRKAIKNAGGYYPGTCRNKKLENNGQRAVRLKMSEPVISFTDRKHGQLTIPTKLANEDFIIKRRDGLFAYNLAVVLDDIDQGITEIVRGADLIEPTGRQISLYKILGQSPVSYVHLPLALDNHGNKLSKQNHAPAIDITHPKPALLDAMIFLGFEIMEDIKTAPVDEIIAWGVKNWQLSQLPGTLKVTPRFSNAFV